MTMPTVSATVGGITGSGAASGTSTVNVNMASGIISGDRALLCYVSDTSTVGVGFSGWTSVPNAAGGGVNPDGSSTQCTGWFYRDCDGTEGTTMPMTRTVSGSISYDILRVDKNTFDPATAPILTEVWFPSNNQPNPPSLTSGFGSVDTLWIAGSTHRASSSFGAGNFGYPTNYTLYQIAGGGSTTGNGSYGKNWIACRALTAASEDPGSFNNGSSGGVAWTMAIKGAVSTFSGVTRSRAVNRGGNVGTGRQRSSIVAPYRRGRAYSMPTFMVDAPRIAVPRERPCF